MEGSAFRIVEFEPEDPEVIKSIDVKAAFAEMGGADAVVEDARHPCMHRTNSVDYAIILSGEITSTPAGLATRAGRLFS
jgi:hypothetical protein